MGINAGGSLRNGGIVRNGPGRQRFLIPLQLILFEGRIMTASILI
jgi:hypothetical protein